MKTKRKEYIKDRQHQKPTEFYPCGHLINIPNVGEFPRLIKKDENEEKMGSTFILSAITANFVYYLDVETDNIEEALLLNRQYQLIADNYFAYNDLCELVESNASFLWLSKDVKVWQKEEYIKPHLLTPDIKKALNKVDTARLTGQPKDIFWAYYYNGPAKYSKAESLMAVISIIDWSKHHHTQLSPIADMLNHQP